MSLEFDDPKITRLPVAFKPHTVEPKKATLRDLATMSRAYGDLQDGFTKELLAQVIGLAEQCEMLGRKAKMAPYHNVTLGIGLVEQAHKLESIAAMHEPAEIFE